MPRLPTTTGKLKHTPSTPRKPSIFTLSGTVARHEPGDDHDAEGWSFTRDERDDFYIQVTAPGHPGQDTVTTGVHLAFGAASRAEVDAFHAAAVANGYFVLQPNRVGREDNEYGELAVDFYGTSQVIDPRGNFVGEKGSGEHEEVLIRDLDLDMVQQMRDDWQFYRDRRPESYTSIPKP